MKEIINDINKTYMVYTSNENEEVVKRNYIEWVKRSNDVSASFKNKIDTLPITVTKVWREFHLFECKNKIEFLLSDNSFNEITFKNQETVPIEWGFAPTKYQLKTLKLSLKGNILSTISLGVTENEASEILKAENRKINIHDDCLDYCKKRFAKGLDVNAQVLLETARTISNVEVLNETVVIYPEFIINVKYKHKNYGGIWERDYLNVPKFAPISSLILKWKMASIFSRITNFVIFLASAAMALGLIIISDNYNPTADGSGIPMILCGFWLFPINIAGVVLPFFITDNYAIDLDDYKEKTKFYLIYNLIYLGLALIFVGTGHLIAHLVW